MEAILLAMLVGLVLGYLTLRSLGWLCVFFLLSIGARAACWCPDGAWEKTTSGTWYLFSAPDWGGEGVGGGFAYSSAGGGTRTECVPASGARPKVFPIYIVDGANPLVSVYQVTQTEANNCVTNAPPPPNKYCVYHVVYHNTSDKFVPLCMYYEDGAQAAGTFRVLAPGSSVDYMWTNNVGPGGTCDRLIWGDCRGRGGTDDIPADGYDDGTSYTGDPGGGGADGDGDGGTGDGDDYVKPGDEPLQPRDSYPTNTPTGGDFVKLGDRIVHALGQIDNSIHESGTNSGGGGAELDGVNDGLVGITNQLNAIRTNTFGVLTAIGTNLGQLTNLSAILGQTGTNMFGTETNFWGTNVSAFVGSVLSAHLSAAGTYSNGVYAVLTSNQQVSAMTAVPSGGSWNVWELPGYKMNFGGTVSYDLDPRGSGRPFSELAPWIKHLWTCIICLGAFGFIHYRTGKCLENLGLVPGGGPGKGTFSFLTYGMSIIAVTTAFAGVPVLFATGIQAITNFGGGPLVSPISNDAFAFAGTYASHLKAGFLVLDTFFPWVYATTVVAYLWVFDSTVVIFIATAHRFLRHTSN